MESLLHKSSSSNYKGIFLILNILKFSKAASPFSLDQVVNIILDTELLANSQVTI